MGNPRSIPLESDFSNNHYVDKDNNVYPSVDDDVVQILVLDMYNYFNDLGGLDMDSYPHEINYIEDNFQDLLDEYMQYKFIKFEINFNICMFHTSEKKMGSIIDFLCCTMNIVLLNMSIQY